MGETRDFVAEYAAAQATWLKASEVRDDAVLAASAARSALRAVVAAKWGAALGARVISGHGTEYAVTHVDGGDLDSRPYLYGNPLKSDGTPSKQRRYIGSTWTLKATP